MKTVRGIINERTGELTIKVEGCTGNECQKLTAPIEKGLGFGIKGETKEEILPEFYQTTEQQTEQQQGAQ